MELKISYEFEYGGRPYRKGIILNNLERVTEEEIRASFTGQLGLGFEMLILDAVRTLDSLK